ncbi:ML domain-containing protein [Paraphysoderma sedebokerense]|nr:ML domain-containing protein [Paraphysoderma sedebokerense]
MKSVTVILASMALFALKVSALQTLGIEPFIGCLKGTDKVSDMMTIESIGLSPYPAIIGEDVVLTLTGTVTGEITPGCTSRAQVKAGGLPLRTYNFDTCQDIQEQNPGISCPVPAGTFITLKKSLPVPPSTPPLKNANLEIKIFNGDKSEIGCVKSKIDFNKKE